VSRPAELSQADLKSLYAMLEDVENQLGPATAWLPSGVLKSTLEDALGRVISAQWRAAKMLAGHDAPDPADQVPAAFRSA
jgi:hypothetical protein